MVPSTQLLVSEGGSSGGSLGSPGSSSAKAISGVNSTAAISNHRFMTRIRPNHVLMQSSR